MAVYDAITGLWYHDERFDHSSQPPADTDTDQPGIGETVNDGMSAFIPPDYDPPDIGMNVWRG